MLLMYYRTYTTHAFLGFLFGSDDSAVGRNINPIQPLLAGISRIPERRVKLDPEDIRELFFDATERPTRRPFLGRREFYSVKKKRHTTRSRWWSSAAPSRRGPAPSRVGCGSPRRASRAPARRMTSGCTTGRGWSARATRSGRVTRPSSGRA